MKEDEIVPSTKTSSVLLPTDRPKRGSPSFLIHYSTREHISLMVVRSFEYNFFLLLLFFLDLEIEREREREEKS